MTTPLEQSDALFYKFITGKWLDYDRDIGEVLEYNQPDKHRLGIWELKAPDVRFFGWFPCFNIFIVAYCNDATYVKQHNLYNGYIGQCHQLRTQYPVDPPSFVTGGISRVISN